MAKKKFTFSDPSPLAPTLPDGKLIDFFYSALKHSALDSPFSLAAGRALLDTLPLLENPAQEAMILKDILYVIPSGIPLEKEAYFRLFEIAPHINKQKDRLGALVYIAVYGYESIKSGDFRTKVARAILKELKTFKDLDESLHLHTVLMVRDFDASTEKDNLSKFLSLVLKTNHHDKRVNLEMISEHRAATSALRKKAHAALKKMA